MGDSSDAPSAALTNFHRFEDARTRVIEVATRIPRAFSARRETFRRGSGTREAVRWSCGRRRRRRRDRVRSGTGGCGGGESKREGADMWRRMGVGRGEEFEPRRRITTGRAFCRGQHGT